MKLNVKKLFFLGCAVGVLMSTIITTSAMSSKLDGWLYVKNPLWSAPKGCAKTMGFKEITAVCTVSKNGYSTKRVSTSDTVSSMGGMVETDWISGPTYKSAGTKFTSKHAGYDDDGTYRSKTASYKY